MNVSERDVEAVMLHLNPRFTVRGRVVMEKPTGVATPKTPSVRLVPFSPEVPCGVDFLPRPQPELILRSDSSGEFKFGEFILVRTSSM
jgi:hypothetical protein